MCSGAIVWKSPILSCHGALFGKPISGSLHTPPCSVLCELLPEGLRRALKAKAPIDSDTYYSNAGADARI